MTFVRWLTLVAMACGVAQDRAPEPDAAAQKEKLKIVRDLFKDEYARKSPQDQIALAKQLLGRAGETKEDAVVQYVLLKEARELAAAAGDVETALKAVDDTGKSFAVAVLPLKLATLAKAAVPGKDVEVLRSAARAYLALVPEAIRTDDYDSAAAAIAKGEQAAKAAQDPTLPGKAQEYAKELAGLKSEYQKVKADLDKPTPADPEAVGRYLCFVRGAWETGLPPLANGAKGPLKAAVDKDMSAPLESEKQAEVADGWWDLAQKEKSAWRKGRIIARAQSWYEQAAAGATGLTKVKVDKRLAELEESSPGSLNLLRLIDLKQDPFGEWTQDSGTLLSPADNFTRVLIPYAPPEEYDLTVVADRTQGSDGLVFGLIRGAVVYAIWIEGYSNLGGRSGIENIDGVLFEKNPASFQGTLLTNGKTSTIVISVRKTSITASVDGKNFLAFQGNFSRVNGIGATIWKVAGWKGMYLGTCGSRYKISKFQLSPISGQGKKLR
jgi:hypothetical protein